MLNRQFRVLMFAHDVRGLGQLRRLSRIARKLQERCSVLMVTGQRAASWMVPEGCEFVHVPSLDQIEALQGSPSSLLLNGGMDGKTIHASLIDAVFSSFRPDSLIVDYSSADQEEETYELLQDYRAARSYLILRGVLGEPAQVNQSIARSHQPLQQIYDRVFIAADRQVIDVQKEYDLPENFSQRLSYAGYVTDKCGSGVLDDLRRERNIPEGAKWVVCSPGALEKGEDLAEVCYELAQSFPGAFFDIVPAPHSRGGWMEDDCRWKDYPRVRLFREDELLPQLHGACDLLICRGGYNTLLEGLCGRPRIIVFPRPEHYEQRDHAGRLSRFAPIEVVYDHSGLKAALENALNGEPGERTHPWETLDFSGATHIADQVISDFAGPLKGISVSN